MQHDTCIEHINVIWSINSVKTYQVEADFFLKKIVDITNKVDTWLITEIKKKF